MPQRSRRTAGSQKARQKIEEIRRSSTEGPISDPYSGFAPSPLPSIAGSDIESLAISTDAFADDEHAFLRIPCVRHGVEQLIVETK